MSGGRLRHGLLDLVFHELFNFLRLLEDLLHLLGLLRSLVLHETALVVTLTFELASLLFDLLLAFPEQFKLQAHGLVGLILGSLDASLLGEALLQGRRDATSILFFAERYSLGITHGELLAPLPQCLLLLSLLACLIGLLSRQLFCSLSVALRLLLFPGRSQLPLLLEVDGLSTLELLIPESLVLSFLSLLLFTQLLVSLFLLFGFFVFSAQVSLTPHLFLTGQVCLLKLLLFNLLEAHLVIYHLLDLFLLFLSDLLDGCQLLRQNAVGFAVHGRSVIDHRLITQLGAARPPHVIHHGAFVDVARFACESTVTFRSRALG